MKNINLISNEEFLIELENKTYILEDNKYISISNICDNNLVLKVYPLNQSRYSLPYCLKIESQDNQVVCKDMLAKVYNLKDRCDIFIKPFLINSTNIIYSASHIVKNIKYLVTCFSDRIMISSKNGEYSHETTLDNVSSCVENNNITLLSKINEQKKLIIFNTNTFSFYEILGNQIEIKGEEITALQNLNDMAKHIKVSSYLINNDFKQTSEVLYLKGVKKICKINELIPYNFFEALKVKDFSLARTFLSNNLSKSLSDEMLSNFFGDFNYIQLSNLSPLTYTLYSNFEAKDYYLKVENQVIFDIEN